MKVYRKIKNLLSLAGVNRKDGKKITQEDLSIIPDACLVENKGKILWVGPEKSLPKNYKKASSVNLKGATVAPAFVECHTHSVFAGNRSTEFELRQQGVSYQEIAKRGGGIQYTVKKTRAAKDADLKKSAQDSADDFLRQGVTVLEIKGGYGLNSKEEERILKIASSLKGPRIVTTYLGPHALSPDYKNTTEYLQQILVDLAAVKKVSNRVDMFVEDGYFSIEQAQKYYQKARAIGMDCVVHADQMTYTGATRMAVEIGAISCDHVIYAKDEDLAALAKSKTTAVLLPTSDQYLKIPYPRARKMLEEGVRVALATDYNPGTSPTRDLSYVGVLARVEMKMLLHEVIAAYTYNAAHALGVEKDVGTLEVGKSADFIVLNDYHDLFYQIGQSPVEQVYRQGKRLL